MGNRQLNAVWRSDAGATMGARFTLLALADRASNKAPNVGYCYPGYDWIAKRVRCSKKTIERAIKLLQKEGHLIVKSKHEGGTLTHHYLVTTGLFDDEIKGCLLSQFSQTAEGAESIVEEVRRRQAKKVKKSKGEDGLNPSFFALSQANCSSPPDNVTNPPDNVTNPPDNASPPTRHIVAQSLSYPSADPSADPSAREARSLKKNQQPSAKRESNSTPALSAKKGNNPKQNEFQDGPTTHAKEPPPSSAAPPPISQMTEALKVACGFKDTTNSRQRKRLKKKLGSTATQLLADGYTAECVATMRKWWDTVGIGSNPGSTPPHPSQVETYIDTALAWEKAGSQVMASKQRGEYALYAEQPKRTQADVEATRRAYDEGLFEEEVNEYGF